MKITAIETHVCHARMRNWIFVKVLTDQPGCGAGARRRSSGTPARSSARSRIWPSSHRRGPDADRAPVADDVSPAFLARQRRRPRHGDQRHRHRAVGHRRQDPRRALPQAVGRAGARLRSARTATWAAARWKTSTTTTRPMPAIRRAGRPGGRRRLHGVQDRWPCPRPCRSKGLRPIRYAEACVRAMREAVGDEIDIMVDCHARPSPRMGLLFAKALEPYGLYWFEEPCWPESVPGDGRHPARRGDADRHRRAADRAARLSRVASNSAACSVAQPDITHCGGLSEARRIAAMAEAYRVALAPHNPQGPVSTAASLELGFATPSYIICEAVHLDVPWRQDVVHEGFTVEPRGPNRAPQPAPGPGHRDQRSRSEEAPVPAGTAAARVLRRRQRGRLVRPAIKRRDRRGESC